MTPPSLSPTPPPLPARLSGIARLLARRRRVAYHLPDLAHAARCAPLVMCALLVPMLALAAPVSLVDLPEPDTLALVAAGLAAAWWRSRR